MSGQVVVFDKRGRVLERVTGPYDDVKHLIVNELTTAGRFFWIEASAEAYGEEFDPSERHWLGESKTTHAVTLRAMECPAAGWIDGGKHGRQVAEATWLFPSSARLDIPMNEIWKLIREAALVPRAPSAQVDTRSGPRSSD
jgi:hypothetical protein